MLLKIADNTIIETRNIISIEIQPQRYPEQTGHWNEEKQIVIYDRGHIIEFLMIGDITCRSYIYNTLREAETKLTELIKGIRDL